MGELHLEILVDRLQREFNVGPMSASPRSPTARPSASRPRPKGRYVRQTGGRGQYGHVKIRIEPSGPDGGFVFESKIIGGSIPKEYIKPIRDGISEAMEMGILAGYPMRTSRSS